MVVLDFHATEFSVDLLEIEAARIKLAAEPVEHLPVKGQNGLKAALAVTSARSIETIPAMAVHWLRSVANSLSRIKGFEM
jgi:hypothetical protein